MREAICGPFVLTVCGERHNRVPTSSAACQAAMSDSRQATRRLPTRTGCGNVPAFIFR